LGDCLLWFLENDKSRKNFGATFFQGSTCTLIWQNGMGNILRQFFTNVYGHPGQQLTTT
jgi:hypothetical protein